MSSPHFGLEALILGIPAVGMLISAFFRLDELIARPNSCSGVGRPLSHWSENGQLVCIEPDGRYSVAHGRGLAERKSGHLPRRSGARRARRDFVDCVRENSRK